MSIDDKLREILLAEGHNSKEWIDGRMVPAIKQAFADKGYINFLTLPKGIYNASGKALVQISSEQAMTGKEWYERFSAEIGKLSHISIGKDYQLDYSTTVKRMLEAARKASGIENE